MVLEREIVASADLEGDEFGTPAIGPGPDGRVTVFVQCSTPDGERLVGFDGRTGRLALAIPLEVEVAYALTLAAGAGPAHALTAALPVNNGPGIAMVDLATGQVVVTTEPGPWASSAAGDLFHDGEPEIVTGAFAYTPDGRIAASYTDVEYTVVPSLTADDGGTLSLLNAGGWWDAATGAGVAWGDWMGEGGWRFFNGGAVAAGGDLVVAGHDGQGHFVADRAGLRWLDPPDDDDGGRETAAPVSIGDLDGNGIPELVADLWGQVLMARDLDGTVLWQRTTGLGTPYIANTAALADLDADGRYEVVIWGDQGLWILAGADGSVLARWEEAVNWSWIKPPVIVDVDGDGSAEIVVVGRRERDDGVHHPRLFILGPASGRWARTRPVWNQLPYDVTAVRDDGTIPAFPFSNPATYNSWRAQPAHDGDHPDLEIEVVDSCRDDERDVVAVQAVVHNRGSRDAPAGAIVRLLTWDAALGGPLQEVDAETLADPIPAMTSSRGVVLRSSVEGWATRQVVQVDGAHPDECDRVNDRIDVWVD